MTTAFPGGLDTFPNAATLAAGTLGSDEHSTLHDNLGAAVVAIETDLLAGSGPGGAITHLTARKFGLGTTATTAAQTATAMQNFFNELGLAFTEAGLDRSGLGVAGEFSAGIWNGSPLGHTILAPVNANGGDVIVYGQGQGSTTLTLPDRGSHGGFACGSMGNAQTLNGSATRAGNVFTLAFTGPWFPMDPTTGGLYAGTPPAPTSAKPICQVGDPIVLQVLSRGVLRWAHYTCTANHVGGDYKQIQYNAFDPGSAVDGCIPPTGQTVYFPAVFIQPLNFRNPHSIRFRDIAIESGSKTQTPLDGIGARCSSGCTFEDSVELNGWWAGDMVNGGPMPVALTGGTGQNSDHSETNCVYSSCMINRLFLTNSQQGANANGRVDIGGGRDNHMRRVDSQAPGLAHIVVADDGTMATVDLSGTEFKSGQRVIYGEGIAGVQRLEDLMIDGLTGFFKTESTGNLCIEDESRTGTIWALYDILHRFADGITINGSGQASNFTDQPYDLTGVTLVSGVLTATVTQSGHGLVVGQAVQIGNAGPATTLTSAMHNLFFQQATFHCVDLTGWPASGQALVDSNKGTQLITYTGISGNDLTGCTGGKGSAEMDTGGNIVCQALAQETRIQSFDSTGQTITCPVPQYTGPDISTPTTATMGRIGFVRAGMLKRFEWLSDWDLNGSDRYVKAGMDFDLVTLLPGWFKMNQNDTGGVMNGALPTFRVRDAEPIGGVHAHCFATGKVFQSWETEFSQFDIGKTITCANVAGGADQIAGFIDINNVVMSGTVTNGSGLTWSMGDVGSLDDPRVSIRRGMNQWHVAFHSGATSGTSHSDINAGDLVELITSSSGTLKVQDSRANPLLICVGVAMQPSPAGGRVAVSTNGQTGSAARIILESPTIVVADPGTVLTLGDDPIQLNSTGAIAAGTLLVDNADGTVVAVAGSPTAGQRVVGQSIKAAASNQVGARTVQPYWT